MKVAVFHEYGLPDVLKIEEVETPTPSDDEVLIKVHATSINDWDWGVLRGIPFPNRMLFGVLKPKMAILGGDVAGRVEAVGKKVTKFKVGDAVFGDLTESGWGAYAEYVCANQNALVQKPASITFEQAASLPQASVLAMTGLRDKKHIQAGQKVLINGAGGGTGTFAVQIAKSMGAEVTGVDSAIKLDTMRDVGADHVIDYRKEDFTRNGQRYDLILELISQRSVLDYRRALTPNGVCAMVGGTMSRIFEMAILGSLLSMMTSQKMGIVALRPNKDLDYMLELIEAGKVTPVIDKVYQLSEIADAFRYFGDGQAKGKLIISME